MAEALIALGGNAGNVAESFRRALDALNSTPGLTVRDVSSFHETSAVSISPSRDGPRFVNASARLDTVLEPLELLDQLQDIETRLGRVRTAMWGVRTLDLDLLFLGDRIVESPRLTLPHPAAWYRRFVLDPLCEIAAEFVHPAKHVSINQLRERLLDRPLTIGLAGGIADTRARIAEDHHVESDDVRVEEWRPGDAEPTFIVWLGASNDPTFETLPLLPRVKPHPAGIGPAEFVRVLIASSSSA